MPTDTATSFSHRPDTDAAAAATTTTTDSSLSIANASSSSPYPRGILLDAVKEAAACAKQNELYVTFDVTKGTCVLLFKNFMIPMVGLAVIVAAFVLGNQNQHSDATKVALAPLLVGCGLLFIFGTLGLFHACTAVKYQSCQITSTQIILKSNAGVLCKWESRIPLIRVSDVRVQQGCLDRLFRVTNLVIDASDFWSHMHHQDDAVMLIRAVKFPTQVIQLICDKREACREPPIVTLQQPRWQIAKPDDISDDMHEKSQTHDHQLQQQCQPSQYIDMISRRPMVTPGAAGHQEEDTTTTTTTPASFYLKMESV